MQKGAIRLGKPSALRPGGAPEKSEWPSKRGKLWSPFIVMALGTNRFPRKMATPWESQFGDAFLTVARKTFTLRRASKAGRKKKLSHCKFDDSPAVNE